MFKKYTLIDNFDKINMARYNTILGPNYEFKNFKETMSTAPPGVISGLWPPYNNYLNYNAYNVVPDIYRFVANRRFFIDKANWDLVRPEHLHDQMSSTAQHSGQNTWYNPLEGTPIRIDVLELDTILKDNLKIVNANLHLDQYDTSPELVTNIDGTKEHIAITNPYPETSLAKFQVAAAFFRKKWKDKPGMAITELGSTAVRLHSRFERYSNYQYWNFQYVHYTVAKGIKDEWNADEWLMSADAGHGSVYKYIENLLMFNPFRIKTTANGDLLEHSNQGYRPKHTYFVADFSVGTNQKPKEFDYTVNKSVVEIVPSYNYYAPAAESFPASVESELQLPNIYTYFALKNTYNNSEKFTYYQNLVTTNTGAQINPKLFSISDYYAIVTQSIFQDEAELETEGAIVYQNRAVVITDKSFLSGIDKLKQKFPYGIEVLLPSLNSPLAQILSNEGSLSPFMSILTNYFKDSYAKQCLSHNFIMHRRDEQKGPSGETSAERLQETLAFSELQVFDLSGFIDSGKESFLTTGQSASYKKYLNDMLIAKFGKTIHQFGQGGDPEGDLGMSVLMQSFESIKNYINIKRLGEFYDVWDGKKCHTEPVVIEIAKYKKVAPGQTGAPAPNKYIQSIFLPATGGIINEDKQIMPLKYFDTQVFYGEEYVYEIFVHTLVVGATYETNRTNEHANPNTTGAEGTGLKGSYLDAQYPIIAYQSMNDVSTVISSHNGIDYGVQDDADFFFKPYALIVRAPFYNNKSLLAAAQKQETTTVLDMPPLPPEIRFIPYRNVDNKILVLLNINYGQRTMLPIKLNRDGDHEKIQQQLINQQHLSKHKDLEPALGSYANPKTHLIYKTDDSGGGTWRIYRSPKKPQAWGGHSPVTATTINSDEKNSYEDKILKNTDYYYFARYIDVHGNVSNPTNIFYLRMVKEEGFPPYLIVKPFYFKEEKLERLITDIPFKKYLKVNLRSSIRKIVGTKFEDTDLTYDFPHNSGIKYKFRVTSVKTGKKIDVNVDFSRRKMIQYSDGIDEDINDDINDLS
tara:strand:- start:5186 stop:8272 length:3087 start_codon:yes stop_codon:yes gene_type:complete